MPIATRFILSRSSQKTTIIIFRLPEVTIDLARLSFHVPANGLVAANIENMQIAAKKLESSNTKPVPTGRASIVQPRVRHALKSTRPATP